VVLCLQYAFYFLVVGAAIWASSWAGKFHSKFLTFALNLDFLFWIFGGCVNVERVSVLLLQRFRAGCGQVRGNQRE